jgi:hypothetical protein
MEIKIIEGLAEEVYEYIAPFAMDKKYINMNGNPIITSKFHKWFIGIEKGYIMCFCSVKFALSSKSMVIGNYFNIRGNKGASLIRSIIKLYVKEKQLALKAFSNNENLEMYQKLGFSIQKEGKNWHRLKFEKTTKNDKK